MADVAANPTLLNGSGQAPADAGNAAAGGGGSDWRSQIPEAYREADWAKKYTTPEDFYKGVDNMSKLIGQKTIVQGIEPPGKDAKPEDWDKFYSALGRPESPDKYELPEVKPEFEHLIMEGDDAIWKDFAHTLGLTPKQAAEGWSKYGEIINDLAAKLAPSEDKALAALERDWGKDTRQNLTLASRAAQALGMTDALNEAGLGLNPTVLKLCAEMGRALGESRLPKVDAGGEPELNKEKLRAMMADPRYADPARRDPAYVKQIEDGFAKLFPGKKRS